jgi:hypothetical protein
LYSEQKPPHIITFQCNKKRWMTGKLMIKWLTEAYWF